MITAKNASLNFSIIKLSWIRPNGSPSPRKRRHHQFSPLFHIPNIPNISILVLCQNSYWSHGPVEIVSFPMKNGGIFPYLPYQHSQPLLTFHFPMVFPWFSHGFPPWMRPCFCSQSSQVDPNPLHGWHANRKSSVASGLPPSPGGSRSQSMPGNTETIKINRCQ